MKHLLLAICGWLLASALPAQFFPYIQQTFESRPCPYNDSATVIQSGIYQFYRTVDDTYTGEIDSSWCADFQLSGSEFMLDLDELGEGRALFVRIDFEEGEGPELLPYRRYSINQNMWLDNAELRNDSCSGEFCSGFFIEYDFFDELTTTAGNRSLGFDLGEAEYPEALQETCFFSERFALQRLRSLTMKLSPVATSVGSSLKPYDLRIFDVFDSSLPIEAIVYGPEHYYDFEGVYRAYTGEVINPDEPTGFLDEYYIPQVTDTVPGPEHFNFIDVELVPNVDSVQQIELIYQAITILNYPAYTGLRGGLVAGSDSLRHALTLTLEDESIFPSCFGIVIEVVADQNTTYRYGSGTLKLANSASCFRVEPGGTFAVIENSQLNYGAPNTGTGLFATKDKAWVSLEENSSLTINSNWQLAHRPDDPQAGAHVNLQTGSQLVFGPKSSLYRSHPDGAGYLYVHMNGGTVDVSALSEQERGLIRYVYPEGLQLSVNNQKLTVYPNPVREQVEFLLPESLIDRSVTVQLFDALGRRVISQEQLVTNRLSSLRLPTQLPTGTYRLFVTAGNQHYSAKLLKGS